MWSRMACNASAMLASGAGLCITGDSAYRRLCAAAHKRKGFDGLASLAQHQLGKDPFSGQLFVFRGRRGDLVKVLSWDGRPRSI
jgi:transposase